MYSGNSLFNECQLVEMQLKWFRLHVGTHTHSVTLALLLSAFFCLLAAVVLSVWWWRIQFLAHNPTFKQGFSAPHPPIVLERNIPDMRTCRPE